MTIDTSVGDFIGEASVPEPTDAQVESAIRKIHEIMKIEEPEFADFDFDKFIAEEPERHAKGVKYMREALKAGIAAGPAQAPFVLSDAEKAQFDRMIRLFTVLADHFSEDFCDDLWNLRNRIEAFKPGDEHYDPEIEEFDQVVEPEPRP